jgi:hypothetical protein
MTDTTEGEELLEGAKAVLASARKRGGGPKSAAGKKTVCQNAVTHGMTSPNPVAGGEDPADWEAFNDGWYKYFQPVGIPEEEIVDFLAITCWRRRRIIRREVAIIDTRREMLTERSESKMFLPFRTRLEAKLDAEGCDVSAGVRLLEVLDTLDSDSALDLESASGAFPCGRCRNSPAGSSRNSPPDSGIDFSR